MENIRLPRPAKVRIERAHKSATARVFVNDVDVSHHVSEVSWSMRAGKLPMATVTFADVEVDVAAEDSSGSTNVELQQKHQATLSEVVSRLREVGLFVAADFLESVSPVERRERVIKAPEPAVKRTPEHWCQQYGVDILDHDGWRGKDDPPWTEPITLADFYERALRCTVRNCATVDWQRIARDAKAS